MRMHDATTLARGPIAHTPRRAGPPFSAVRLERFMCPRPRRRAQLARSRARPAWRAAATRCSEHRVAPTPAAVLPSGGAGGGRRTRALASTRPRRDSHVQTPRFPTLRGNGSAAPRQWSTPPYRRGAPRYPLRPTGLVHVARGSVPACEHMLASRVTGAAASATQQIARPATDWTRGRPSTVDRSRDRDARQPARHLPTSWRPRSVHHVILLSALVVQRRPAIGRTRQFAGGVS